MHVEQASPVAIEIPLKRAPRAPEPPTWLIAGLAAVYVLALAALAFLPGATLLQRLTVLDSGVCTELVDHTYFPAGQQLPLCARCTGMYLGFAATTLLMWGAGRLRASGFPGRRVALLLGLAIVVMGVDGFNSLFNELHLPHLYQPQNTLRLATGLGTGVAMARHWQPRRPLCQLAPDLSCLHGRRHPRGDRAARTLRAQDQHDARPVALGGISLALLYDLSRVTSMRSC